MQKCFIDELLYIKKVDKLVNKFDDYEGTRHNFKKGTNQSCNSSEKRSTED